MNKVTSSLFASSVLLPLLMVPSRAEAGPCPAFGAASTCGAIITITNSGSQISFTGQGPYDGNDDTLVGVVNNSNQPIFALGLQSTTNIFGFDGDGVNTYGSPGKDATGYGGPNSSFSNFSGNNTSGVVNFNNPLQPGGGATYFSLENALTRPKAVQDIVNNSIIVTLGGRGTGTTFGKLNQFRPTNIQVDFTPNGGLTLAQAATQTGFKDFNFQQTITSLPANNLFFQVGNPNPLSAPPTFNDPPLGGYTYKDCQQWAACLTAYPFYPTSRTATTLTLWDSPKNSALKAGESMKFSDRLIGILPTFTPSTKCLVLGTCVDLGVGVDWTSNYNGTFGGIAQTASNQPVDPATADGLGGITVTNVYETTNYSPFTVTTINGVPITNSSGLIIDLSQPYFIESDQASQQPTIEFAGGTLKPTTSYTFAHPVQLDPTGGVVDSSNGNLAFTGVISGSGALIVQGGNAVSLTNSNNYTGGTTIFSGGLVLGTNTSAGAGAITIADGALSAGANGLNIANAIVLTGPAVVLGGAGLFTLSGNISGSGSLNTTGIGTTILSGTGTYTGITTISAGTLQVDGTLNGTSSVIVNSGGTLTGIGTINSPTVTVASGATFAPGTPDVAGTSMNMAGGLVFQSGANYLVRITPSASTFASVTGTASLAGSVRAVSTLTSAYSLAGTSKAILKTTDTIGGTFSGVSLIGNLANSVVPTLVYKRGEVDLAFPANTISSQLPGGLSRNQASVAHGLDAILATNRAPPQFVNLFALPPAALAAAMSQLDGELGGSVTTPLLQSSNGFLDAMLDPARRQDDASSGGAPTLAYAEQGRKLTENVPALKRLAQPAPLLPPTWSVWASALGGSGWLGADSSRGTSATTDRSVGVAVGADYRPEPATVFGFAMGAGSATRVGRADSATGNLFQFGVYASTPIEEAYVSGALAYTHADTNASRTVAVGATVETLSSKPVSDLLAGRIEVGHRFAFGSAGVTPYAALTLQNTQTDAYAESSTLGVPVFGLAYQSSRVGSARTELGSRFDLAAWENVAVFGRLAWVHQSSAPSTRGLFAALPTTPFTIRGAALPSDSALLALNTDIRLAHDWRINAAIGAELAPRKTSVNGHLTLRYQW